MDTASFSYTEDAIISQHMSPGPYSLSILFPAMSVFIPLAKVSHTSKPRAVGTDITEGGGYRDMND